MPTVICSKAGPQALSQGLSVLAVDNDALDRQDQTTAASNRSGVLFFTLPTDLLTGRLTSASSFAGFISAAAASGSAFSHRSQVSGSSTSGIRLWN
jgi:hypothetical protein